MPIYFLDSSAVVKLYLPETGSQEVSRIVSEPDSHRFISRLAVVEVQRAFSRRVRTKEISQSELDELRRGFYEDLVRRRIRVKQLKDTHYRSAVRLVYKYALVAEQQQDQENPIPLLRTLDAIHLATAIDIRQREGLDYFVSADEDLCKVAEAEHLSVINPVPSTGP